METLSIPGEHRLTLRVDGRTRECLVHTPHGFDGARELPLVLMFHGGGGTARLAAIGTGWSDKADQAGFFVAYPEGVRPHLQRRATFLRNPQFFNAGSGIGYAEEAGVDDHAFVRALLDELCDRLPIDQRRVYACGFSNGASAAFQTAMDMPERIAAIAPVAGHLWRTEPAPSEPIPMIYIIGTADPLNPMAGGVVTSPWEKQELRPPIARSVETWADWIGCGGDAQLVSEHDGLRAVRYGLGEGGAVVEFVTIVGAGHVWPGGPDIIAERIAGQGTNKLNATGVIWDFFERHPKP